MDVFRGVAVLSMIVVHTTRVTLPSAPESAFGACASQLEPAVSVAFLWLVGWSLERAYERASHSGTEWRRWYASALLRATTLYFIGTLLFVLQYGVEAPDVWASPDVLGTIAWAIVLSGALSPLGRWGLIGGTVATLVLSVVIEARGFHVSGVNAGPGAALPLVGVACVGACHGRTSKDRAPSSWLWAGLGLVAGTVALAVPGELVDLQPSGYKGTQLTPGAAPPWFWNHTVKGILLYGGGVAVGAAMFSRSRGSGSWAAPLRLLGRHALVSYVGHLLVLGVMDRWLGLPSGWPGLVSVALGLGIAFVGIAMALESELGVCARLAVRRRLGLRI